MKIRLLSAALAAAFVLPGAAWATNGYFAHGYGVKAQGMGGVGIALPQDSLAAATNPAGMVMVGNRLDVGVTWFRPVRNATIVGNMLGSQGEYDGNDTQDFYIPEFGYNRMLNPNMAVGVSVYGNGGMNTDYKQVIPVLSAGANRSGVDLVQLFIAPTFSMKLNPNHAVGVSLNLAYQQFAAKGLEGFIGQSNSGGNLTGQGHDDSTGWGVRIGWTGQVSDSVTLGATYQSKTRMSKLDKYKGLFAEQGGFDIPANYGVGLAWKMNPKTTFAADLITYEYSDVKSVANPLVIPANLGADNGAGFGWRDMTVLKLGVSYEYSKDLTLRAGFSSGRQPIPESQTFFNILAPGVIENHLTLGATWTLANKSELSIGYMHGFEKKVNGSGSTALLGTTDEVNLKMHQDSIGIAYGWKM
jgi:long-chain fatty acid transport protein